MKAYKGFIVLLFSLLTLIGCDFEKQQRLYVLDKKPLTYAIYMAGDNDLEDFAIANINALKKVGSSDNMNIVVLLDRSPDYNSSNGNWSDTRLLYITKGHSINYDIVGNYPFDEEDMTDSENLYQFLRLVNDYYPSDKLILNIWSHGYGVNPDGQIPQVTTKGVIVDDSAGSGKEMSIVDLKNALNNFRRYSGRRVDILQFDACNMLMLEIAEDLRPYARFIVGAETDIPQEGSDYSALASYFEAQSREENRVIASYMVDSFNSLYKNSGKSYSYGAIDSSKVTSFLSFFDSIVTDVLSNKEMVVSGGRTLVAQAVNDRKYLSRTVEPFPEFCDLYEFLNWCIEKLGGNASSGITKSNLDSEFDSVVVNYCSSKDLEKTRSLGINIPYTVGQWREYRIHTNSSTEFLSIYSKTKLATLLWEMYNTFSR